MHVDRGITHCLESTCQVALLQNSCHRRASTVLPQTKATLDLQESFLQWRNGRTIDTFEVVDFETFPTSIDFSLLFQSLKLPEWPTIWQRRSMTVQQGDDQHGTKLGSNFGWTNVEKRWCNDCKA